MHVRDVRTKNVLYLTAYESNIKLSNENYLRSDIALGIKDCWCDLVYDLMYGRLFLVLRACSCVDG